MSEVTRTGAISATSGRISLGNSLLGSWSKQREEHQSIRIFPDSGEKVPSPRNFPYRKNESFALWTDTNLLSDNLLGGAERARELTAEFSHLPSGRTSTICPHAGARFGLESGTRDGGIFSHREHRGGSGEKGLLGPDSTRPEHSVCRRALGVFSSAARLLRPSGLHLAQVLLSHLM